MTAETDHGAVRVFSSSPGSMLLTRVFRSDRQSEMPITRLEGSPKVWVARNGAT